MELGFEWVARVAWLGRHGWLEIGFQLFLASSNGAQRDSLILLPTSDLDGFRVWPSS